MAKKIICTCGGCDNCDECKKINENIHENLIIVNTNYKAIKKENIVNIKNSFQTTTDTPSVYIIKNAELMNPSAANALLKFLEEPDSNVIAILMTADKSQIMETIYSRCTFHKPNTDTKYNEFDKDVMYRIVNNIETSMSNCLIDVEINYNSSEIYKNKESLLDNLLLIYLNLIKYRMNVKYENYYVDNFCDIIQSSDEEILRKVKIINKYIKYNRFNLNGKLMFDNLFIELTNIEAI